MAQKDNALGAPTEGLGQHVTFAFDPMSPPQLQLSNEGDVQAGVQGGGTAGIGGTRATGVQAPPNPTLDLLMKVGADIIKPRLERAKTDAFITGMQRAMQGEAVADIASKQPWYATLFGESDVVEGARAYTGQTVAQTEVAGMEDQMPELRKMDPEAARTFFINRVQSKLTGDRATDGSILQAMTKALPSIMRKQSKEHYGWQQENATAAETASFQAGAGRLQMAGRGLSQGYTTPEEFAGITEQFVRSVIPATGRDPKNYKESMQANLIGWARDGNFHALNALRDRGFFSVLDPEQLNRVDAAVDAGEARQKARYSFAWSDDLAKIEQQAGVPQTGDTTNDLKTKIDALNNRYQAEVGTKSALIDPGTRAALLTKSYKEIAQERDRQYAKAAAHQDKLNTAGDKAQAEANFNAVALQAFNEGNLGALTANPKYGDEKVNGAIWSAYRSLADQNTPALVSPAQVKALAMNVEGQNYVIKPVRDAFVGQVNSVLAAGTLTPEAQGVYENYKRLRAANPVAAYAYFGQHAAAMEGMYTDIERGGQLPESSFNTRFVSPKPAKSLSKDEMEGVVKAAGADTNWFSRWWAGESKVKPGTARRLGFTYADQAEALAASNGGNFVNAFKTVLQANAGRNVEIVGGYDIRIDKDQQSLGRYLTMDPQGKKLGAATDKINEVFESAVDEVLYGDGTKSGILPDKATDTMVVRLPDKGGVPMFHIRAINDGKPYDAVLSASDVYSLAEKRNTRNDANRDAMRKAREATPVPSFKYKPLEDLVRSQQPK